MENPEYVLQYLGFTSKEIDVYLAGLELGMAPISVIANKAKLKRTSVYDVMKKLAQRGVVHTFLRKKTKYYSVISPTKLHALYSQRVQDLEAVLPTMRARENALVQKPNITFHEGKEDVKRLYLDILNAKDKEVLNYFLPDKPFEYFGEDWIYSQHIAKRVEKGIRLRVIMPATHYLGQYKERSKKELRTIRLINPEHLFYSNEAYVYDNKMSIFSFDENFALLIESPEVVRMQRTMFELAWESTFVREP